MLLGLRLSSSGKEKMDYAISNLLLLTVGSTQEMILETG